MVLKELQVTKKKKKKKLNKTMQEWLELHLSTDYWKESTINSFNREAIISFSTEISNVD